MIRVIVANDNQTLVEYAAVADSNGEPVAMRPGREMDLSVMLAEVDAVVREALTQ